MGIIRVPSLLLFLWTTSFALHAQSSVDLDGNWVNVDPAAQGITRIEVRAMTIRPFSGAREWGNIPVIQDAQGVLHGEISRGFSTVSFDVSLTPKGMLRLHDHRHYTDNSSRPDNDSDNLFTRSTPNQASAPPPTLPLSAASASGPIPLPPQPPSANDNGPTLEQTLDFINHSYADQGVMASTVVKFKASITDGPFTLTPDAINSCVIKIVDHGYQEEVHLKDVDPRSVRILSWVEFNKEQGLTFSPIDPEIYVVTLRQSAAADAKYAYRNPEVWASLDKSLTERVAKAWIHAVVLCGGGSNSVF